MPWPRKMTWEIASEFLEALNAATTKGEQVTVPEAFTIWPLNVSDHPLTRFLSGDIGKTQKLLLVCAPNAKLVLDRMPIVSGDLRSLAVVRSQDGIQPIDDIFARLLCSIVALSTFEGVVAFSCFNMFLLILSTAKEHRVYLFNAFEKTVPDKFPMAKLEQHYDLTLKDLDNISQANLMFEYALMNGGRDMRLSNVKIACEWQANSIDKARYPSSLAQVNLLVRSVSGKVDTENYSSGEATRQQLTGLLLLNRIRQKQASTAHWKLISGKKVGISTVINEFLAGVMREGALSQHAPSNVDLFNNDLPARKNLDFTDRVWVLAQDAASYEDFLEVMTAIAEELETGRLKPMVHKSNQTQFANLIREALKISRVSVASDFAELKELLSRQFDYWLNAENLEDDAPLITLLIETGIHKLKQDYFHWLVNDNLLSWDQLTSFFEIDSTTEQIFRLHVLNRIVELLSLVRRNVINVPFEVTRILVQQSFKYWTSRLAELSFENLDETMNCTVAMPRSAATSEFVSSIARSFAPCEKSYSFTLQNRADEEFFMIISSERDGFRNGGLDALHASGSMDVEQFDGSQECSYVSVGICQKTSK